jgi:hypothetical protein
VLHAGGRPEEKEWSVRRIRFLLTLVALSLLVGGCGLWLDIGPEETRPSGTDADPHAFLCEATITRASGGPFLERWQGWVFPGDLDGDTVVDDVDGRMECERRLSEYVARALPATVGWSTNGLTVTAGDPGAPDPLLRKRAASDCPDDDAGRPFTTGAPRGADVVLEGPPRSDVAISIALATDAGEFSAAPDATLLVWRLAERHGYPQGDGSFDTAERHLRVSDLFLEVETPFSLGDVQIDRLYVQSVGTTYARQVANSALYVIDSVDFDDRSKFFFFGSGRRGSEGDSSPFCFEATGVITESQGTEPQFGFTVGLDQEDLGAPMVVLISVSADHAERYQPRVDLADVETSSLVTRLGAGSSDTVRDNDGDLDRVLWYEDLEAPTERFLGEGLPLSDVRLAPGVHTITALAYDARDAYDFDTFAVTVLPPLAADDAYVGVEDTPLVVSAPGVLGNDTDAGVHRSVTIVTDPSHGLLTAAPDGSFTYVPDPNFFGTDRFTYVVDHDGLATTGVATVTLTVEELTTQEELDQLAQECEALEAAGSLTPGQANACQSTLGAAAAAAESGNLTAACNQLAAFLNRVDALVRSGALGSAEGSVLVDRAENLRTELGCS